MTIMMITAAMMMMMTIQFFDDYWPTTNDIRGEDNNALFIGRLRVGTFSGFHERFMGGLVQYFGGTYYYFGMFTTHNFATHFDIYEG